MKEVKTQKRYKCDFCKKRGIKRKMEFHEGICYRNPNRMCVECKNTGKTIMDLEGFRSEVDCHYCSAFDKKKLEEIEKREAQNTFLSADINNEMNVPF